MAEAILVGRKLYNDTLLADVLVGSTVTDVDISGFTIEKNEELRIVATIVGITGTSTYRLFVNGNNLNTSYYRQEAYATSTTRSASRSNDCVIAYNSGATRSSTDVRVKLTNQGYVVYQAVNSRDLAPTSPKIFHSFTTSTFTITSITSIRISSATASRIAAGTRIQVYKVGR